MILHSPRPSKARSRSAAVVVEVESDLPRVRGFVGELNQIWANLIDNALDAIPDSGLVEVRAHREHQRVVVRIVDKPDATQSTVEVIGPGIKHADPQFYAVRLMNYTPYNEIKRGLELTTMERLYRAYRPGAGGQRGE